jgi:hypothetical protein
MNEFVPGYKPPLPKGTKVVATAASELAKPGTLGVITWTHPFPEMPYRVKWDMTPEEHGMDFGMSDIGDLTRPDELEPVEP